MRISDWSSDVCSSDLRQEVHALKRGLVGHIKIAAIPTALAMVSEITTPYRAKHPHVKFTILSRNSIEILSMLENLEADAGRTYLDHQPLGKVLRSADRRVGTECVSTCKSRGWQDL